MLAYSPEIFFKVALLPAVTILAVGFLGHTFTVTAFVPAQDSAPSFVVADLYERSLRAYADFRADCFCKSHSAVSNISAN